MNLFDSPGSVKGEHNSEPRMRRQIKHNEPGRCALELPTALFLLYHFICCVSCGWCLCGGYIHPGRDNFGTKKGMEGRSWKTALSV